MLGFDLINLLNLFNHKNHGSENGCQLGAGFVSAGFVGGGFVGANVKSAQNLIMIFFHLIWLLESI
ncbi:MAG: hypothetical protein ORN85_10325 [Sediminibacterium sp.]|nr:hypothetical protein [Sediminibacterium sp.]